MKQQDVEAQFFRDGSLEDVLGLHHVLLALSQVEVAP